MAPGDGKGPRRDESGRRRLVTTTIVIDPTKSLRSCDDVRSGTVHSRSTSAAWSSATATTTALAGIDFEVPTGTVTAVLGPNGAGKTTAVRILTTLADADEGEATVAGFDVRTQPTEVRRRIGLAAQDATVDPLLTGRENLVMLGELHQYRRKEAAPEPTQLLEEFSLADAADRVASGLLGRHAPPARPRRHPRRRPRGAVPRRAHHRPRPPGPHRAVGGARHTSSTGARPLLLTTQYLDEAERLADDIIVIDHGRIIARGDARKLKREVGGDHIHVVVVDPDRPRRRRPHRRPTSPASSPGSTPRTRSVTAPTSQGVDSPGRGGQRPAGGRHRGRRPQPAPAHARRGVPDPDRATPPTTDDDGGGRHDA